MTTEILVKFGPDDKARPQNINYATFGHYAYIHIGEILILVGPAPELAHQLRQIANAIEPKSVAASLQLPPEMDDPYTAWPWLVKRYPWLFGDIDVSREPYSAYLKAAQPQADFETALDAGCDVSSSQADIAQALFDDRTKTGGSYRRRILAVKNQLKNTTTTSKNGVQANLSQKKAA